MEAPVAAYPSIPAKIAVPVSPTEKHAIPPNAKVEAPPSKDQKALDDAQRVLAEQGVTVTPTPEEPSAA